MESAIAIQARLVFPIVGPPMHDAVVTIHHGRIAAIGPASGTAPVRDLGNVALVPGLVNAHTHLEFSHLAQPLGYPGIGMADWIRLVMASRQAGSLVRGVDEAIRYGTTTLGEIAQPDADLEPLADAPLDAVVFHELIGPTLDRADAALDRARRFLEALRGPRLRGLSPHAPYTVHPKLLEQTVALAARHGLPVAMHLAESDDEMRLLRDGSGPLRALLDERGAWTAEQMPAGARPLDYLRRLAHAPRALVIHGNYLDEEEIAFLAEHSRSMAVVYCPRTHAWFRHPRYPLAKLLAAGATVALGADSRASSPDLNLLADLRAAAQAHPDLPPATFLRLATLGGAQALGLDRAIGTLEPGKWADLCAVTLPDRDAEPHELFVTSDTPIVARWHHGRQSVGQPGTR